MSRRTGKPTSAGYLYVVDFEQAADLQRAATDRHYAALVVRNVNLGPDQPAIETILHSIKPQ